MKLSRWAVAAAGVALLLLSPVPVTTTGRVRSEYRHLCTLLAKWNPNAQTTSVSAPAQPIAGRWHGLVSGLTTATIHVTYDAGFPPAARTAFQAAVDIWATQLSSSVPIEIQAQWLAQGSGLLGTASSTYVYDDFGAGMPDTFYHAALASKLRGSDVDTAPDGTDITATFNSSRTDWYFGTDGNPPFNQYDFESVVLHELGHGLGFSGSGADFNGQGSYGVDGGPKPMIYDRFVETSDRRSITNTSLFPNPSIFLHSVFTSEDPSNTTSGLFWNGAAGIAAAGGGTNRPRLDARSPWLDGSNFSHLSESTYLKGNQNSLMTRALENGESIHDPGPLVLGMFEDEGWSVACSYALSNTSVLLAPAASTGNTITVTTRPGCAWSAAAASGSFATITGGASGIGNGTVTYSVSAAPGATPRSTTLTIGGQVVTITQGPLLAIDKPSLRFGATNQGGTLSTITSPQTVVVSIAGSNSIAWTAAVTSSTPWLQVSGGSGNGSGSFSVSVVSHASLNGATSATGTITVSASGTVNTPKTITVTLAMVAPGGTAAPFGAFDTPAEGTLNLTGSVAVTGWALDDIEVLSVQIQRDAHPNDPPGAVSGGRVFVGNATLVDGARPDVEAAAPTIPRGGRAGWGYLMLTRGVVWDGLGPFKLYAVVTDADGHTVTIGSKTVAIANAGATKPFGAIDSPAQRATVSGNLPNTGWAISPVTTIPVTATAVRVAIDGVFLSGASLLQGDTFSAQDRADITAGFSAFNTTGAGRGNVINTTLFANGVHTIGWFVTDAASNADGIGSRFFTIQNSSLIATSAAALVNQPASQLAGIDSGAAVRVATGFNPRAALTAVPPDALGRRTVRIGELDRVEVRVASSLPPKGGSHGAESHGTVRARYAAYHVANGQLRALPVGSSFDPRTGTLYWQPGAGYVGNYDFVVVDELRRDAKRLTHVTVRVGELPSRSLASAATRATN